MAVVALTLILVSALAINRFDDYFRRQQQADLAERAETVAQYAAGVAESASTPRTVVADGIVDPAVVVQLQSAAQQRIMADRLAQADVLIRIGTPDATGHFVPASNGTFESDLQASPRIGQTRETITSDPYTLTVRAFVPYVVVVTLSNPYTFRAAALASITGALLVIGLATLGLAAIIAAALARRFTTPLRRLTEAARGLAEGDLGRRIPAREARAGSLELTELALQFNTMAARLQESVEIVRRDRDRSRDFLADVSHELRTPIAALRTFNELLKQRAGADPEARTEFLESSGQQIDRLDWLAQNLLELSKLDSGLVLLDLRPDDLRAAVEQATEQAEAAARKRGVRLAIHQPGAPIRIHHDPVRIGQVVANLVGNAIKFTPKGGEIAVDVAATPGGARIVVNDTGVGIDAAELPRIFDRFYRGSLANEARGSGSGLGLAIVRSIVDMHGGSVTVESRLGLGSTFTITLPRQPALTSSGSAGEAEAAPEDRAEASPDTGGDPARNVADSSSSEAARLNEGVAP